jgi:nucleoid-associated protein YgaU
MTRENKLALVLGFGLLLLAGILVSDYLSAGNRVHEDPLIASRSSQIPDSEILKPAVPPKLKRSPQRPQTAQDSTPPPLKELTMGRRTPRATAEASRKNVADADVYFVKKGESLSSISTRYYGTPDRADQIAKFNNLGNPNQVRVGTRLVLPKSFSQTVASSDQSRTGSPATKSTPRSKTVEVREGETLSDIAKRELGDGKKWRVLWLANKKVVPNPDRLSPGTVLQLPTT